MRIGSLCSGVGGLEGCRYEFTDDDGCGLARLGVGPPNVVPEPGDLHWVCGAMRAAEAILAELEAAL